jgi:hypothetical protein
MRLASRFAALLTRWAGFEPALQARTTLTDFDRAQLSIIEGELNRISSTMTGIILGWDRIFAIGALVFGGGLSIGLAERRHIILVLLPLPICLLNVFGNLLLMELSGKGGYRRFLEEKVNLIVKRNLLAWEPWLTSRIMQRSFTGAVFLPFLYSSFLVGAWILSLSTVWHDYKPFKVVELSGIILSFVFVAVSTWEGRTAWNKGYELASEYFGQSN